MTSEQISTRVSLTLAIIFVYTMVAGLNYDVNYWENNCYEKHTIAEISKAHHRTVWVTLNNGQEIEIGQPSPAIHPGDTYCTDLRRERTDEQLSWWMLPVKLFE